MTKREKEMRENLEEKKKNIKKKDNKRKRAKRDSLNESEKRTVKEI